MLYLLMINIILIIVINLVAVIDIFVIILILVDGEITDEVRIHLLLTKHSLLWRLILLVLFVKVARQRIFLHFAIACLLQRLLLSILLLFIWWLIKLRLSIRFLLNLDRLFVTFLIFQRSFCSVLFCRFLHNRATDFRLFDHFVLSLSSAIYFLRSNFLGFCFTSSHVWWFIFGNFLRRYISWSNANWLTP